MSATTSREDESTSTVVELQTLGAQANDREALIDQRPSSLTTVRFQTTRWRKSVCIMACLLVLAGVTIIILALELSKANASKNCDSKGIFILVHDESLTDSIKIISINARDWWQVYMKYSFIEWTGNAQSTDPLTRETTARTAVGTGTLTTNFYSESTRNHDRSTSIQTKAPPITEEPEAICYINECMSAAKDLASYISPENSTANPCTDFYEYACGNKSHDNDLGFNAFDALSFETDMLLQLSLSQNNDTLQQLKSVRMARSFFATCADAVTNETAAKAANLHLAEAIKEVYGGWNMKGENNFPVAYLAGLAEANENADSFISVSVSVNLLNVSQYALVFDQPTLGLNDEGFLQPEKFPAQIASYKRAIEAAVRPLLQAEEPSADWDAYVSREADAIFNLETDLAKLKVPQEQLQRNHAAFYRATTLNDLMKTQTGALNWSDFLLGFFGVESFAAALNDSQTYAVVLQADSYFTGLFKLYSSEKHSNSTWHSYLIWRILRSRQIMLDNDLSLDDDMSLKANSRVNHQRAAGRNVVKQPRRSAIVLESGSCYDYAKDYFPWVMTRLLSGQLEAPEIAQRKAMDLELITDAVLSATAGIFTGIDWLDLPSKLNAERKQNGIVKHLMYPEWIFDDAKLDDFYDLPESGWSTVPFYDQVSILNRWSTRKAQQKFLQRSVPNRQLGDVASGYTDVNAFYVPEENSITIPAPIVQPPFYRPGVPKAVNYGGIGFTIGHEISHGYDAEGVQYFDNGTIYRWLDRSSFTGFITMDQCIIDQYNGFCDDFESDDFHSDSAHLCVNGNLTQAENLADNAGVRAAWFALKAYENSHGPASRLPLSMKRFSSDQLFFLSFARPWCESPPSRFSLEASLRNDVHSPNKWRVNGALRNFKPFAKAWQCKAGSPMAPLDRCHVW